MSRAARTAGSALAISALIAALVAVLLALAPAERAVPAGRDGPAGPTPDGLRGQEEPGGAAQAEMNPPGSRSASTTDDLVPALPEDRSTPEVADAAIPPSRPTAAPAQPVQVAVATREARRTDPDVTEIGEPLVIEDVTEIGEPLVIEDVTEIGEPLVIEDATEIGEPLVIERAAEVAQVAVAEAPRHVDVDDPHVHVDLRVAVPEPLPDPELAPLSH